MAKFELVEGWRKNQKDVKRSGAWPQSPVKALEDSIEKWEFIVRAKKRGVMLYADANSCALCHLYNTNWVNDCSSECPVKRWTGIGDCRRSPYESVPTLKQAEQELRFLRALLVLIKGGRE